MTDMTDMNEMNEELDNIITLTGENGEEVNFEFVDLIEYESREFVVLLPVEEDEEEEGQVVILEVEPVEGSDEECYVSVDDEDLLMKIFEIFKERFADEFNFE